MAINFETWITGRMARHQEAETERNAPAAVALGALDTFREALVQMTPSEWSDMRSEVYALIAELDEHAWQQFSGVLAASEG